MSKFPIMMYFDYFKNEYVLKKDEISPPERYIKVYSCMDHTCIEGWKVTGKCNRLNIAFDYDLYRENPIASEMVRRRHFEENKCEPICLIEFGIPKHLFEKYCSELMENKNE